MARASFMKSSVLLLILRNSDSNGASSFSGTSIFRVDFAFISSRFEFISSRNWPSASVFSFTRRSRVVVSRVVVGHTHNSWTCVVVVVVEL